MHGCEATKRLGSKFDHTIQPGVHGFQAGDIGQREVS